MDLLPTLSFHQLDPGRLRSSYRPRGLDAGQEGWGSSQMLRESLVRW